MCDRGLTADRSPKKVTIISGSMIDRTRRLSLSRRSSSAYTRKRSFKPPPTIPLRQRGGQKAVLAGQQGGASLGLGVGVSGSPPYRDDRGCESAGVAS